MRSVVVVLPASMCAMMPMLRTLFRSMVMSTATWVIPSGCLGLVTCDWVVYCGVVYCGVGTARRARASAATYRCSPAVVGEGLVGLGHLVGVLATLHSSAEPVGGVEDLCLLYTSDAADDLLCVDLGGRRI